MTDKNITFGSRRVMVVIRAFQIVLPLFFVALMVGDNGRFDRIFMITALLIWEIFMSTYVFARLTDEGLAYLRWSKWRELRWSEIAYGGVGPVGFISIKLRGPIWRKYLLLKAPNLPTDFIEASSQAKRFLEAIRPPSGRTN